MHGSGQAGAAVPRQTDNFLQEIKQLNVLHLMPNFQEVLTHFEFPQPKTRKVW